MKDGLYFLGRAGWQWVTEVDYSLNKQANDLTKPDTLQMPYSGQFSIPNTLAIQKLLENAEQPDAGGKYPYVLIPARLIENDEILIDGRAELQSFRGGWQVAVYDPQRAMFDRLGEKKLRDLDLSRLDHAWTLEQISAYAGATDGVVYPLIDYGTISDNIVPQDTLFPAVFVSDVVGQILQEQGYKAVGGWLTDPLFKALAIPFSEERPSNRDQEWVDARSARVTVDPADAGDIIATEKRKINQIQRFSVDNRPLEGWTDGKVNNYNTATFTYIADATMRLHVTAYQQFEVSCLFGSFEVKLIVEKNGANVAESYFSKGGPYNLQYARQDQVEIDTYINVVKGDQIAIRFIAEKRSKLAEFSLFMYPGPETMYASFSPDMNVKTGDSWPVARNLPDMTCTALLKSVAFIMSGWFDIDDRRKTVELVLLSDVTSNRANAVDWSTYLEETSEPELQFQIAPYAQKNLLKWREEDGVDKKYGDGVIRCDKSTLPAESTLFELPFSATMDSQQTVAGYGSPLKIETRTVSGFGNNMQISSKAAGPRLILVEPDKTFEVSTQILNGAGAVIPAKVRLTGCWFGRRPQTIVTDKNAFSLAFDPVPGQLTETGLIARYFNGLKRVLRRPRLLSVSLYIRPSEYVTINSRLPIRLRNVRVGDIEITDGYFYLNKLENYQAGKTCTGVLIAF
ncbi:hypothetical protein [Larkinella arboricola]